MNDGGGINNGPRRMDRLAVERAHLRDLPNDGVVEIRIGAKTEVKFVCAIKYVLKLRFKLGNGKRFVGAKLFLRAFNSGATSHPNLLLRVTRTNEQGVLLVSAGCDDG